MRVGLLFGSFNPIHIGHLIIAQSVLNNSDLEKIWFVVSPQNPFKDSGSLLHEFDRIDMVREAIGNHPDFHASDIEFSLPKPSYTSHTLAYLSERFSSYDFKLIIGEDNLLSFDRWKNYEAILNDYGVYVYPRPVEKNSEFKSNSNITVVDAPVVDISSTLIRKYIKEGKSVQYLTPEPVYELIKSRKYYT
ncbi:MAG: nicotinate (nicotinamide) nucleotide adenylyltransferase [Bacteroidota bacterium]